MESWYGATFLGARKNGTVAVAGDGQMSLLNRGGGSADEVA